MNSRNVRLIALIAVFSCSVTYAPRKNLLELAHAITQASHRSGRKNAREQLLNALKNTHTTDPATLSYIFNAFHHKKDSHLFDHHAGTINRAIAHFTAIPGFVPKIHTLLSYADNPAMAKGHSYELEAALMKARQGYQVIQFGYDFYCNRTHCMRSIDLVTDEHFIECKDRDWNKKDERIQRQLLSYKAFTKNSGDGRSLLLVSKQPITPKWVEWLEMQDIAYEQTH